MHLAEECLREDDAALILYHASKEIVEYPEIHNYDIVEGPMADDTIWNYVNDFLYGDISREQFWELAKFKYPTHQISFHTLAGLNCLTFERSEIVYDRNQEG